MQPSFDASLSRGARFLGRPCLQRGRTCDPFSPSITSVLRLSQVVGGGSGEGVGHQTSGWLAGVRAGKGVVGGEGGGVGRSGRTRSLVGWLLADWSCLPSCCTWSANERCIGGTGRAQASGWRIGEALSLAARRGVAAARTDGRLVAQRGGRG